MPDDQCVEQVSDRRQVDLLGRDGVRQTVKEAANVGRRDGVQGKAALLAPPQESARCAGVGSSGVRVAKLPVKELLPAETCARPRVRN